MPLRQSSLRVHSSYRGFLSDLNILLRDAGISPVAGPSADSTPSGEYVVGQVQAFVEEHLAADLTVEHLADVADVSPSSLARRFGAETDTTPWRYVMERRIEAAKRLLAMNDRSLAEIAFDTGFYDQAHLTRTFRRFEGVTPGTYRDEAEE
ncbi:helix-turn-helix domain-containing protein [Longibacter sp.]|jgi:AraC family transcriptional regulator|uniref:helix-turn-helix domain-containing protein n=1 Tax=Longibacter sp. TaxID=2045415 RepID=UPI003EB7D156